ncbi:MAG: glycosyltransferase family 87 protein [Marmoricola sp.]
MVEGTRPSHTDPVARDWSERVGGPVGDHRRPHRWLTPVRVLLAVFTIVSCLGIVQKVPCLQTQWTNNDVRYAKMCYSDIPYLYTGRGMAEQTWPYSDTHGRYQVMEYPVGISYFAWGAAWLTRPFASGPPEAVRAATPPGDLFGLEGMTTEVNQYFLVNAVLLIAVGLLATYFLAGAHRRRPWDAMAFAASPLLLLTGLINWDLLAVAAVAGAFWAWARGKPVLAGAFLGLGTATKLYPLFLFGAMLVVCLRRGQPKVFAKALAAGLVTWLVLNLPALLTGFDQWKVFWTFNSARGPDLGSLWIMASNLGHPATSGAVNLTSWVLFSLACVAILVLGLTAKYPPRMAQLGFLIVAAFLLVNKVYSPQYVLWLLPLAVLARPRWRDLVIWQACELVYFAGVWLYLGGFTASATTGATDPAYLAAIAIRVAGEVYLMVLVTRDILDPSRDPVRTSVELHHLPR